MSFDPNPSEIITFNLCHQSIIKCFAFELANKCFSLYLPLCTLLQAYIKCLGNRIPYFEDQALDVSLVNNVLINKLTFTFYLSDGKASAYNVGDPGSIPGLGRSPGEGNGNPLQYSCLENPMGREAWQATVHEVARKESNMTERLHFLLLSNKTCGFIHIQAFCHSFIQIL